MHAPRVPLLEGRACVPRVEKRKRGHVKPANGSRALMRLQHDSNDDVNVGTAATATQEALLMHRSTEHRMVASTHATHADRCQGRAMIASFATTTLKSSGTFPLPSLEAPSPLTESRRTTTGLRDIHCSFHSLRGRRERLPERCSRRIQPPAVDAPWKCEPVLLICCHDVATVCRNKRR